MAAEEVATVRGLGMSLLVLHWNFHECLARRPRARSRSPNSAARAGAVRCDVHSRRIDHRVGDLFEGQPRRQYSRVVWFSKNPPSPEPTPPEGLVGVMS